MADGYSAQDYEALDQLISTVIKCREPITDVQGSENSAQQAPIPNGDIIANLITILDSQGIKRPDLIDKYMQCYPHGKDGYENYLKYKPFIEMATKMFHSKDKKHEYRVNPSFMKCLLKRESNFNPKAVSPTDAVGLGQHTDINIKDIRNRLKDEKSEEYTMWKEFFAEVRKTKAGKKMLQDCPGSSNSADPRFKNEEDAKCPLQSIAAASIYNLQIQKELYKNSEMAGLDWAYELDFQLAIAAAYNLGNTAARNAVDDKGVSEWLKAILAATKKKAKKTELSGHVNAIRNCLQEDNWEPMSEDSKPVCKDFSSIPKVK